ncbi:MAG: sporulation protein YqfD [Clostridia bacterium]|nr:sporulation protein YqfD [Clostridia bacterium]
MILQCFRWLFGYVSFELIGECPEKFINLTIKNEINIWDIKKKGFVLKGKVLAEEYRSLRQLAKKSCCKVKIKSKKGFPFIKLKYKKRMGFFVGALFFLAVIYAFSFFIWSVNVGGNESIATEEILRVASDLGVRPGALKKSIDVPAVKSAAMSKLEDVAWISINISGSSVNISVKEKIKKPEIAKSGEPCNIIANSDGQIERMETFKGTPCVNVGDVVVKGQLLISGVMENLNAENYFLDADGKVFAKTRKIITEKAKINQTVTKDTGKIVTHLHLKVGNIDVPIFGYWECVNDNYRLETSENAINFFGFEIPLKMCKDYWYEQKNEEITLTNEEAYLQIENNILKREKEEFKEATILDKKVNKAENNGELTEEVEYICTENIACKEKIVIEP